MHASQTRKSRSPMSPVAVAVLAALATAGPAGAQQAPDAIVGLEEIIVTAQKREQNLQEVPIAVSVVTGGLLDSVGGVSTEALKRLVPTLNIRKTNTSLNQALFLRGVGTINFAIAAQPSVAFVLDGVVMSSAGEAFAELYDVNRVEVLAGPQGTLYGKNASAGVVNVVSTRPGDQLEGYVDLGYFQDGETRVKAAIDVPISDKLRTRTTAFWGEFDGYIDNISTTKAGGDTNGYDRWGVRSIWVADPTDNLSLLSSATTASSTTTAAPRSSARRRRPPRPGRTPRHCSNCGQGVDFKGVYTREIKQDLEMKATDEAWGLSLQADVGIGEYTLTSITAYRTWDATEWREGDWKDVPAAYVGNPWAQQHDYGPQTLDTFSQELRIASPGGEFVDYVAGLYYATTSADRYFQRDDVVCTASTLAIDATGQRPCTAAASTIVYPSANADFGADFDTFAAFADGTFNLTDRWRLIGGVRWTQDDLSYLPQLQLFPDSQDRALAPPPDGQRTVPAAEGRRLVERVLRPRRRAVRLHRRRDELLHVCPWLQGARLQRLLQHGPQQHRSARSRDRELVRDRPQVHAARRPADPEPRRVGRGVRQLPGQQLHVPERHADHDADQRGYRDDGRCFARFPRAADGCSRADRRHRLHGREGGRLVHAAGIRLRPSGTARSCRSLRPGRRTSPPSTRWNSATSTSCRRCWSTTRGTSTAT